MMSEADRHKAADTLMAAEKARKQAVQLSKTWPDITIEDAYAISTEVAKRKMAAGAKLIGHKVGLTSKAMQRSSQIDEPDYGHLLDYMMVPDGGRVPHENYCLPRVEIELAFILGKPLKGPGVQLPDVLRATDYVVPAIEIVDARQAHAHKLLGHIMDLVETDNLPVENAAIRSRRAPQDEHDRLPAIGRARLAFGKAGEPTALAALGLSVNRRVRQRGQNECE